MTIPTAPRYEGRARDHAGTSFGVWDSFAQEWMDDDMRYPTLFRARSAALKLNREYNGWDGAI